jgi:hypothetical protein
MSISNTHKVFLVFTWIAWLGILFSCSSISEPDEHSDLDGLSRFKDSVWVEDGCNCSDTNVLYILDGVRFSNHTTLGPHVTVLVQDRNTMEDGLVILEGSSLFFESSAYLNFSTGYLQVKGTSVDSVLFTALDTTTTWGDGTSKQVGLDLGYLSANSSIAYGIFEYSGTALLLDSPFGITIKHSAFRNNAQYGIFMKVDASKAENTIEYSSFANNGESAIYAYPNAMVDLHALEFDSLETLHIESGLNEKSGTWEAFAIPWSIDGKINLSGGVKSPEISVDPGAHFLMNTGAWIMVSTNGSLNMNGTQSNPITMQPMHKDGTWGNKNGAAIEVSLVSDGAVLNHVITEGVAQLVDADDDDMVAITP